LAKRKALGLEGFWAQEGRLGGFKLLKKGGIFKPFLGKRDKPFGVFLPLFG